MKGIAILSLIIGCIFSIYEMIDSKSVIRSDWFKSLDRSNKIKVTALLKSFWKKNIVLIALMIAMLLILIATFSVVGNRYQGLLSIVSVILAIISVIINVLSRKLYNDNINEFSS